MSWMLFGQILVLVIAVAVCAIVIAYCAIEKWFEEREL